MEANDNIHDFSRRWFDFCFKNPEKIKPSHTALYFFCIEHCNRLGWRKRFGLPTAMAKEAIGLHSYNTYNTTLNDLVSFGFIKMVKKSKNQYSSNMIELSNFDKALIKHDTKQSESTVQSTTQDVKSTTQSTIQNTTQSIQSTTQNIESKDNHTKDDENKFDFKKEFLKLGVEKKIISDWLIVRRNKKGSNTETAFNRIKSEIGKTSMSANDCIKYAVIKNWVGFEADWIKNVKPEKTDEPSLSETLNLYIIPNDHHFGYDQKTLYQRCLEGKYPKR